MAGDCSTTGIIIVEGAGMVDAIRGNIESPGMGIFESDSRVIGIMGRRTWEPPVEPVAAAVSDNKMVLSKSITYLFQESHPSPCQLELPMLHAQPAEH